MTVKSTAALKAKVKAAQKTSAAKVAAAAEDLLLNATLALESSEVLFQSRVKLAASSQNTKTLQTLVDQCSAMIDEIPVQNSKTRTVRKWVGVRRFAFGNQINIMHQLVTGILYSCAEHKQLLLEHTKLDLELLEQFTEAFGSPAYYNRNFNTLVEAKDYNVDNVMAAVSVMQSSLGVIVDTSQLTPANFSMEFGNGEIKAHEDRSKADAAIADMDTEL